MIATKTNSKILHMRYVLIHGAWQGGWCWKYLVPFLKEHGHQVSCLDLPGHGRDAKAFAEVTYDDYYQSLVDEVSQYPEPVILVAHSMSGMLAAPLLDNHPEWITHLFLIAAFVPQGGQSLLEMAIAGKDSEIPKILITDKATHSQSLDLKGAREALYHDCPAEIADWAVSRLQPQSLTPLMTPVNWVDSGGTRNKRTYILCEEDRDVHPTTQRMILERYPCRVINIQSGHFPFLSQPENLAKIIQDPC